MIIWLTGGSGSGKSLVASLFSENGYTVIDADKIARAVVEPGKPALGEIRATFGDAFFLADGTLDRKKLGQAVFSDAEKLAALNKITLSHILREMETQCRGKKNAVLDAPLRNTTGFPCDRTLFVTAPCEVRIARIMERDALSRENAEKRIMAQDSDALYEKDADAVIINDGDKAALLEKATKYIKEWFTP